MSEHCTSHFPESYSLCKYTHIHHAYFGYSLFEALISDSIGVYVAIGNGGKTPVEDHVAVVILNHIQVLWHGGYWGEGGGGGG